MSQKFYFDQNFFDPEDPRFTPEIDARKPRLEFTQSQLNEAEDIAFESGKVAGFKDSQASLMQDIQKVMQKVDRDLSRLFAAEESRNAQFEAEALHLSLLIVRKLFPVLVHDHAESELKKSIQESISTYKSVSKLKLEVHPSLEQGFCDFINQSMISVKDRVVVISDTSIGKYEYRLLWENGGVSYDMELIANKIMGTMKESLAVHGITVHDASQSFDSALEIRSGQGES